MHVHIRWCSSRHHAFPCCHTWGRAECRRAPSRSPSVIGRNLRGCTRDPQIGELEVFESNKTLTARRLVSAVGEMSGLSTCRSGHHSCEGHEGATRVIASLADDGRDEPADECLGWEALSLSLSLCSAFFAFSRISRNKTRPWPQLLALAAMRQSAASASLRWP